eukprot:TRINITY_DN7973_c0_g1_i7.p2 TRINITY_DN7973_c0_g1~~TRINITY_DN7973_c0_g1_i7.p2  ORF type:complete len:189 (+),score=24.95 TRINITY_DN7973_c0_g1_i7:249-815(+)
MQQLKYSNIILNYLAFQKKKSCNQSSGLEGKCLLARNVIENDPEIIDCSLNKLSQGRDHLMEFCDNNEDVVRQVVIGRASNLCENLASEAQQLKFKFLKNELGLSAVQTLEDCPLITRYSLKRRLAPRMLFVRTRQKKDVGNLLALLMLSDERFVKSIANCELEEYQQFVETEFEEFQWPIIQEQLNA